MTVMEALTTRRAIRNFRPDRIGRDVLTELAKAATLAPSHMNLQPWAFAITDDPATVAKLGHAAKHHLLPRLNKLSPFFHERDEISAESYDLFYGAPALIVICATGDGTLADMGCNMAAYSLMLAAHSMGLGTCYVSQAQPWLESHDGRRALGVPAHYRPIAPVIVGVPDAIPLSPGRFDPQIEWIK